MLSNVQTRGFALRSKTHRLTLSAVLIAICIGIVLILSVNQSVNQSVIQSNLPGRMNAFVQLKGELPRHPSIDQPIKHSHEGESVKSIDTPHSPPSDQPSTDKSEPSNQVNNQHNHDDDDDDVKTDKVFDSVHNHTHDVEMPTEKQKKARQSRQAVQDAATALCQEMIDTYHIQIGVNWGDITNNKTMQDLWAARDCDTWLALANYPNYLKAHPELLSPISVSKHRQPPPPPDTQDLPSIAICVCTTTRGVRVDDLTDLSLFNSLMPSILNTTEPGYEYWIYVLYDVGDAFYDNDEHLSTIREWVTKTVTGPMYESRKIHSRLVLEPFENVLKKPGPAFNYLTHLAYIDGADYIYRINDDSSFASVWAKPMVERLLALGSPYGVIGPLCREGNVHILTHDFVHRLHHEIFETFHYPASLSDWWMDDWVSRVYGKNRTILMNDVIVKHATKSHGTRYAVDFSHAPLLGAEVEFGRQKIENWMIKQIEKGQDYTKQLDDFRHDEFHFHF